MTVGAKVSWGINFLALALLLVSCISAPIIDHLSLGTLHTQDSKTIRYGVMGYCQTAGINKCSAKHLGYSISDTVTTSNGNGTVIAPALDHLTYGLVMHPIATGLAGLAFIIALASDRIGFFFSACAGGFAFLASVIAMAIDLSLFGQIISKTKKAQAVYKNQSASYGVATWLTVIATALLFIGIFINLGECICGRRKRRGTASY